LYHPENQEFPSFTEFGVAKISQNIKKGASLYPDRRGLPNAPSIPFPTSYSKKYEQLNQLSNSC
jgi:hypothetical protein